MVLAMVSMTEIIKQKNYEDLLKERMCNQQWYFKVSYTTHNYNLLFSARFHSFHCYLYPRSVSVGLQVMFVVWAFPRRSNSLY